MPLQQISRIATLFYEQVCDVLQTTKKNEINIILGNFNAKIGREAKEVGKYGLRYRNDNRMAIEITDKICSFNFIWKRNMSSKTHYDLPLHRLYMEIAMR